MSDPKEIKAKEFFTIELDHKSNNVILYVNGELRNKIHTIKAESLFDRMLKIAKLKIKTGIQDIPSITGT